jgi:acyl dehydratase
MNDNKRQAIDKTVTGNFFEDFTLGQEIVHATLRTVTVGDVSLFTALYGPRFAVQSSDAFAQSIGYPRSPIDDLLVFHIVIGKTVPDISRNAIANLGYAEFRFLAPVYPGDTLASVSEVIGVKENSNKKSGTVYVRSTGRNQRGEKVLSYARWVMVNKRNPDAPAPTPVVPELAKALRRLFRRRQDRPRRWADHRRGRASARDAPVPEHGARSFQPAHRGQGPVRAAARLWRPHHLHRPRPELQRSRQRLPHSRAEWRPARRALLRRRHHLCVERGSRQSRGSRTLGYGRAPLAHLRGQGPRLRRFPRAQGRRHSRRRRGS